MQLRVTAMCLLSTLASTLAACRQDGASQLADAPPADPKAGLFAEIRVESVPTPPEVVAQVHALEAGITPPSTPQGAVDLVKEVVNVGKDSWQFITQNKGTVDLATDYANAVPKGVDPLQLDSFSGLQYESFHIYALNPVHLTMFDLTGTVVHQYGGRYAGKGHYLSTVGVLVTDCHAIWGVSVDASTRVASVSNVGTEDDPVAQIALELQVKAASWSSTGEAASLYTLRGDSAAATKNPGG